MEFLRQSVDRNNNIYPHIGLEDLQVCRDGAIYIFNKP